MALFWRGSVKWIRSPIIRYSVVCIQRSVSKDVSVGCTPMKEEHTSLVALVKKNNVLLPVEEEDEILSVGPELRPTFNFAAYANKSKTIQELVRLGVDLTKWERRKGVGSYILRLDFDEHMKQHIMFLYDIGVPSDDLGRCLSRIPDIFKESIDDLQIRYNYLLSKNFDQLQIARIVTCNPGWLLHSTVEIDERLGFFQRTFQLSNDEVRHLSTKRPQLITTKIDIIKNVNFMFLEEMGFDITEMKSLIISKPKLWTTYPVSIMRRFDYVHNEMGLTHEQIVAFPKVLTSRDFRLKQRHSYLKLLSRNQYDGSKPNYVSPDALIAGNDVEFCTDIAKTSVIDFNEFLKTL